MDKLYKIKIAIADDHKVLTDCTASTLEMVGFEVVIKAYNGSELIAMLEKLDSVPDVCILDVNMPVMNGLETLVALQKKWPEMRVLVLSIADKEQIILRMLMEGACGYLVKNCSLDVLKKAVETVHKTGVYYSERVSKQLWSFVRQRRIKLPTLTAMEWKVLEISCSNPDMRWTEIATQLRASVDSVHGVRDSIFRKLQVHSRAGLVKLAIQQGFIPFDQELDYGGDFYKKIP